MNSFTATDIFVYLVRRFFFPGTNSRRDVKNDNDFVRNPGMQMESWKVIEMFPNYEISDCGNVRNIRSGRILNMVVNSGRKFK
jgi:hypothetical protein